MLENAASVRVFSEQKRVELEDMFLNYLVPSIGADIAEILPSEA